MWQEDKMPPGMGIVKIHALNSAQMLQQIRMEGVRRGGSLERLMKWNGSCEVSAVCPMMLEMDSTTPSGSLQF